VGVNQRWGEEGPELGSFPSKVSAEHEHNRFSPVWSQLRRKLRNLTKVLRIERRGTMKMRGRDSVEADYREGATKSAFF
jgi:hypothetical protein